jgi:hypothetical protein
MQLTLLKTAAILGIGLASTASAYVIALYDSGDCTGDSTELNVWDNTCATPGRGWGSAKVVAYGGRGQNARFHTVDDCGSPVLWGPAWADDGDDRFQINTCISFGQGHVANAAGSFGV